MLFAVFGLIFAVLAVVLSVDAASEAKNGEPVEPKRVLEVTLLPWRADRATVEALTKDAREVLPDPASTCLMFLGEDDGLFVFYDVENRRAVPLPVSTVAVKTGQVRSGC